MYYRTLSQKSTESQQKSKSVTAGTDTAVFTVTVFVYIYSFIFAPETGQIRAEIQLIFESVHSLGF